MKKLRVGVWIYDDYKPQMGGGYGYYNQLINAIGNANFQNAEITFLSYSINKNEFPFENNYTIRTPKFSSYSHNKLVKIIKSFSEKIAVLLFNTINIEKEKQNTQLLKKELSSIIDVIYYPLPVCVIDKFPYIYTLWDLGHISTFAFPELNMNNNFEMRKKHHDLFPFKAIKIFCESDAGKNDIIKYLNINEDRIDVIPIFPSEIIENSIVSQKVKIMDTNDTFIHYPAQFWAHKNHYTLLVVFKELLLTYPNLKLLLTGSDKGNLTYINNVIQKLGLVESVLNLGFIAIEELKWIYLNSKGLVMPTYLGPTNMPLLEAAELGCPVACSDFEGHREQLGDYAYYFNPLDSSSMQNSILQMLDDSKVNNKRIYQSKFNITNALISIDNSFNAIKNIRFCWGENDKIF